MKPNVLRVFAAMVVLAGVLVRGGNRAAAGVATPTTAPARQVILLKLDDVVQSGEGGGPVSPRWKRVVDYLESNQIKGGLGIICDSLEKDNPAYFDWIKEHQGKGIVEFWCHGYHDRKAADKVGEFDQGTAEEQRAVIERSEQLAIQKLGFPLPAFGPHWSGVTEETEKALQAVPEIKLWLYGPRNPKYFKKLSLERVLSLENPRFVPDFEKFQASYEKLGAGQRVLVLQGHADAWDDQRWAGFVRIVDFLRSKGCRFMTPSEYLMSVATERAEK